MTWRPVRGYTGLYEVSDRGEVRRLKGSPRCKRTRILRPSLCKGYLNLSLCADAIYEHFYVHQLVAAAFIGPRPRGKEINHKNGVKTDNRANNLEYVTRCENIRHACQTGLFGSRDNRGEKNPCARTDLFTVRAICALYGTGVTIVALSRAFRMHKSTVQMITSGRTWPDAFKRWWKRGAGGGKMWWARDADGRVVPINRGPRQ